jgi:hypothetical protein
MAVLSDPVEVDPLILDLWHDLGAEGTCFYNHVRVKSGEHSISCIAGPYVALPQAQQRLAAFYKEFPGVTQCYTAESVDLPGWSEERRFYLISKSRADGVRVACGPFESEQAAKSFELVARKFWSRAAEFPEGDVYHCTHGQVYPARWIRGRLAAT